MDICYVTDEEDGVWQLLCGLDNHVETDAQIVSLKEAFDMDNSIAQFAGIPTGCGATRKDKNSPCKKSKI